MRRFEFVGDGASKYWEIELVGTDVVLRWGRIGTKGQSKTKPLGSDARARGP